MVTLAVLGSALEDDELDPKKTRKCQYRGNECYDKYDHDDCLEC